MFIFVLAACAPEKSYSGLGVLGFSDNAEESVQWTKIVDSSDGLERPMDVAFNPYVDGQLWVVNQDDDSVVVIDNAGAPNQESQHLIDPYALHFMEKVSSPID